MSKKRQMIEAINAFVVGCKSDNIWDSIKACCILSGWNNLDGCLTPIKGDAPTNYNFVANDYDPTTGLQGDGLTKYLDSNRAMNADPLNDQHVTVYASSASSGLATHIGCNEVGVVAGETGITQAAPDLYFRSRSGLLKTISGSSLASGFLGLSRSSSTGFDYRIDGTSGASSIASIGSASANIFVLARARNASTADTYSDARLAFYSIGEALDLELLDNRVSTLIKDLAKPYVTNAEAKNWIDRVYDNGGTVSQATANAVSSFCDSIESAGIRDRFYRLNLFAGDNLNAALVPLYTGPTYGGTVYGNAVDTNFNFVSADYVESYGLTGSSTAAKYLDTGVPANFNNTRHMSVHLANVIGSYLRLIGLNQPELFAITQATTGTVYAVAYGHRYGQEGNLGLINVAVNQANTFVQWQPGEIATLSYTGVGGFITLYKNENALDTPSPQNYPIPLTSDVSIPVFNDRRTDTGEVRTSTSPATLTGYSIGDGMSAEQVSAYSEICRSFHQSLGRA